MELLVLPDGNEHHSVLCNNKQADQQESNGFRWESVRVFLPVGPIQLACVFVVLDEDLVVLVHAKHSCSEKWGSFG